MTTTTDAIEVKVPDIGDFSGVPVIEVHVAAGDTVAPEDPLISLESDKATMDVPSPAEGVVQRLAVSVGDEVSEGDLILTLSGDGSAQPAACWCSAGRCGPARSARWPGGSPTSAATSPRSPG